MSHIHYIFVNIVCQMSEFCKKNNSRKNVLEDLVNEKRMSKRVRQSYPGSPSNSVPVNCQLFISKSQISM